MAFLLGALASSPALAQVAPPHFPPSTILLNYERSQVGQFEPLEAGASTARVRGADGNWYNPAGLAAADGAGVSTSASLYDYTWLRLRGSGATPSESTFGQTPGFLGVVIGPPVLDLGRLRLGFSLTTPRWWNPTVNVELSAPSSAGPMERVDYSSQVTLSTLVPALSAGYALRDNLRIGVGLNVPITTFVETVSLSDELLGPSQESALLRNFRIDSTSWHLQGVVGVQWDLRSDLTIGLVFKTPGVRIYGSGLIDFADFAATPQGRTSTFIRDESATIDLSIPLQTDVGLGYHARSFSLELDLRYHGGTHTRDLVRSGAPVHVRTFQGGAASEITGPFSPIVLRLDPTFNLGLGGRVALSSLLTVHAGAYTDFSPVNASSTPIFPRIDLYGITAGVSLSGKHLSGALGFGLAFGHSHSLELGPDLASGARSVDLSVRVLSTLVSVSYSL